jgi:hypothetical protein
VCACEPGFICSRCEGTRFAVDYLDTDDQVQEDEFPREVAEYEVID